MLLRAHLWCGMACAAVILTSLVSAPASVASGWTVQNVPEPAVPTGQLASVSCSGPRACIAVGQFAIGGRNTLPLAERWNGGNWSRLALGVPGGAIGGALDGVACASSTACTAVGTFTNAARVRIALIERLNGARWQIQPGPRPLGAGGSALSAVSCGSRSDCTAVGSRFGKPLILHWDGDEWSVGAAPARVGPVRVGLSAVSCPSPSFCTAVGGAAALRWNGIIWSVERTVAPPRGRSFDGVSCRSKAFCVAVAGSAAEVWNGSRWSIERVAIPGPRELQSSSMDAVSCLSSRSCFAVGTLTRYVPCTDSCEPYYTVTTLLAEYWNGARWSTQATPNPDADATYNNPGRLLTSVSCSSSSACTAVGPYTDVYSEAVALAERWNGKAWAVQDAANGPGGTDNQGGSLDAVDCTSSRSCTAVGSFSFSPREITVQEALAEHWNGVRWAVQDAPTRIAGSPGAAVIDLTGLSCPGADSCMAVGTTTLDGNTQQALSERWNGARWVLEQTPSHPTEVSVSGMGTRLAGVSCPSASACTAVGYFADGHDHDYAVADHWNGAEWSSQPTPDLAGATLNAVSCPSSRMCIAVGSVTHNGGDSYGTLAERWNGSRWTILASAGSGQLTGLSCRSGRSCIAVGGASAATWDGSRWASLSVPSGAYLKAVSCAPGGGCVLIGYADGGALPIAERWNGNRLTPANAPGPFHGFGFALEAVSCTSSVACTAVGGPAAGPDRGMDAGPFAERSS
jgi:hypothetical protein